MNKFFFLLLCLLVSGLFLTAQSTAERVINNAKNSTENKVNQKVDQGINDLLDGELFKRINKDKLIEQDHSASGELVNTDNKDKAKDVVMAGKSIPQDSLKIYRKYDFVQGEKILYYEDFENVAVGDFPTGWNTNSTAEMVTLSGLSGKWLSITKDGFFSPDMVKDMPDNFTLEFDVVNRYRSNNILQYNFMIYKSANPRKDIGEAYATDGSFRFNWSGCSGGLGYITYENGEEMGKNEDLSSQKLVCPGDNYATPAKVKFSLWRQKNRLRVYLNEEKVLDIPQAFNSSIKYNVFKLGAQYMNYSNSRENDDLFLISNFRYAIGAPDTRSKLITEGRFSTTGILFDFQKATVKAESYGVLKEIANVLKENATLNVKIVGHTSNDGDEGANLELSKQRAAAVKVVLTSEFKVEAARLLTDGKGGTELVDKGNTAEAKANNRRVEFIKL